MNVHDGCFGCSLNIIGILHGIPDIFKVAYLSIYFLGGSFIGLSLVISMEISFSGSLKGV